MSMEKTRQDFKFKSALCGKIMLWLCGIAPILLSIVVYPALVVPSRESAAFLRNAIGCNLFLWTLGSVILFNACEIQILVRIPMKVVSDSDLIPVTCSDVKAVVFGAKRRWRSYGA